MATYDLEEQEQLDSLKAWWKQYGNLVTWILFAVSMGVAGYQGWNGYKRSQSAQASAVFSVLQKAAAEGDMQRVKAASGELIEKFGSTAYGPLGAMLAGKVAVIDEGKLIASGTPTEIFAAGQGAGKFSFVGEVLAIEPADVVFAVSVLVGNQVVRVIATADEAAELAVGCRVNLLSKAFNPMLQRVG